MRVIDDKSNVLPVSVVGPGRLIGDLSVILNEPRQLDLVSLGNSKFLRIGAEDFRAVIESDASVAINILEAVSGHLNGLVDILRASGIDIAELVAGESLEDAIKLGRSSESV